MYSHTFSKYKMSVLCFAFKLLPHMFFCSFGKCAKLISKQSAKSECLERAGSVYGKCMRCALCIAHALCVDGINLLPRLQKIA